MLLKQLSFLLVLTSFSGTFLYGQVDKFTHPTGFADLHTIYEYKKSNWDGSHASTIFLYINDSNKLESFKWFKGDKVATLVTAVIDWKTFSVRGFQNHRLRQGQQRQLVAKLDMDDKMKLQVEAGSMIAKFLLFY